jgi:hypothetical protein
LRAPAGRLGADCRPTVQPRRPTKRKRRRKTTGRGHLEVT